MQRRRQAPCQSNRPSRLRRRQGLRRRLRAGTSILEVTPKPHTGCGKFSARFGPDALRLTQELRPLNLRGVYLKVVEAGELAAGDGLTKRSV